MKNPAGRRLVNLAGAIRDMGSADELTRTRYLGRDKQYETLNVKTRKLQSIDQKRKAVVMQSVNSLGSDHAIQMMPQLNSGPATARNQYQ